MSYAKSEKSISHIVSAATRVLARKGYARTSLLEIAKEAGMSKGALHYHFPTKESLVQRVLEQSLETIADRTLMAWSQGEGEPFEALRSAVLELWLLRVNKTDEVAVVADLLAQSLYDDQLKPMLANFYRFASEQVTEHLGPLLDALNLKPRVSLDLIPRLLVGMLDGLVMQHFVDEDAIAEGELVEALVTMATSLFEIEASSPFAQRNSAQLTKSSRLP